MVVFATVMEKVQVQILLWRKAESLSAFIEGDELLELQSG